MLSLGWEKAFDRVKQDKLIEALTRMNIDPKFINAINSLYSKPSFRVKIDGTKSKWYDQKSGIRQGCPLSPYLFLIVMTVIFRDVHDGLDIESGKLAGLSFTELLYADDTAQVTSDLESMDKLIAQIEICAQYHGLNFSKQNV